ncbi:MAG: condensation domain-containing protein [bacterium]
MNPGERSLQDISVQYIESWADNEKIHYQHQKLLLCPLLDPSKRPKKDHSNARLECIDTFPLSYAQQCLWSLYQDVSTGHKKNMALSLRIRSRIDIPSLRGAFKEIIARHPALRTTFSTNNGEPLQRVHQDQDVCFERVDTSHLNWNERKKRIQQESQHTFNLEEGPLIRMNLFSSSEQEHILLVTMHPMIFDTWSLLIFLDELRVLYSAQKNGSCGFLLPESKSYADYFLWQMHMLSGPKGEHLWSYWRDKLAGDLPEHHLPAVNPQPDSQGHQKARFAIELDKELTQNLKAVSRTRGKSVYITILAAFYILLHQQTGENEILVCHSAEGRGKPEFARTIGNFMNPVILRQDISGDPSFKRFLNSVHQTAFEALRHQDFPFPLMIKRLQPTCDSRHLLRFMFNITPMGELMDVQGPGQKGPWINWEELELKAFEFPQQEGPFDLALEMMDMKEILYMTFRYNTNLYNQNSIEQLTEHFLTLLKAIVTDPFQRLSEMPLLTSVAPK